VQKGADNDLDNEANNASKVVKFVDDTKKQDVYDGDNSRIDFFGIKTASATAAAVTKKKPVIYTQLPTSLSQRPNGYIGMYKHTGAIQISPDPPEVRKQRRQKHQQQFKFQKTFWKCPHYCARTKKFVYTDMAEKEKQLLRFKLPFEYKQSLHYIPVASLQKPRVNQKVIPRDGGRYPIWRGRDGSQRVVYRSSLPATIEQNIKIDLPYSPHVLGDTGPSLPEIGFITSGPVGKKSNNVKDHNSVKPKKSKKQRKRRPSKDGDRDYLPSSSDTLSSLDEITTQDVLKAPVDVVNKVKNAVRIITKDENMYPPGSFPQTNGITINTTDHEEMADNLADTIGENSNSHKIVVKSMFTPVTTKFQDWRKWLADSMTKYDDDDEDDQHSHDSVHNVEDDTFTEQRRRQELRLAPPKIKSVLISFSPSKLVGVAENSATDSSRVKGRTPYRMKTFK